VTQRPIEIETTRFVEKLPTKNVTYNYLMNLSSDYDRHGDSPVYAVITYNPDNSNSKLSATNTSSQLKGQMAKLGIKNPVIQILPVNGTSGETVIGYDRVTAQGPQNCGKIPGHTTETGAYGDYGLGCTVKDMMAKQVAYPKDLEGQDTMAMIDADRAAAPVDRDARSGEQSVFVPSYVLSELAGNTTN
jgi:pilus assembly protein CpaD